MTQIIKKEVILVMSVLLLLALGLRMYDLSSEGLWNDEAFSVHHAAETSANAVKQNVAETEAAPFGYYLLLHYFGLIFGYGDFSMRFLSVIFSVLSIPILYLIGTRLRLSIPETLLACALMTTSMLQVLYAQEVRLYSLFTFLILLGVYFVILAWQKNKFRYYFWYGCSLLLAVYVNYITVLLVILFSLVLLLFYKKKKSLVRRLWLAHVLVGILSLPLVPILRQQFSHLNDGLTQALVLRHLPHFLASFGLFFYLIPVLFFLSLILFSFYFGLHKLGPWLKKKNIITSVPDWFLLGLVMIFGVLYLYVCIQPLHIFGLSVIRNPIIQSYFLIRHSFFLAPLLYVFVAVSIFKMKSKQWKVIAVVWLLLVNVIALGIYYHEPTRPQWKEATQLIASSYSSPQKQQPLILLDSAGISNTFLLQRYYPGDFRLVKLTWDEQWDKIPVEELVKKVQGEKDFWLILSRATVTKEYYKEILDARYERISNDEFLGIVVYHYSAIKRKI